MARILTVPLLTACVFALAGTGAASAAPVDVEAPRGAVGGFSSPASGTLQLSVRAVDGGSGVAMASVTIDGVPRVQASFGSSVCTAFGAGCPEQAEVSVALDLATIADGLHRLRVLVFDGAGNSATVLDRDLAVAHAPPNQTSTIDLHIGSGGSSSAGAGPVSSSGSALTGCRRPRLTLRVGGRRARGAAQRLVMRSDRRLRIRGRLTCRVAGRRVSAPPRTVVEAFDVVGSRTIAKGRVMVGTKGRIRVKRALSGSRKLVFRHRGVDGDVARVRIAVKVLGSRSGA